MTGTDPNNPDTDNDGLLDGIDASWMIDFLNELPNSDFKRRWHRWAMKLTLAAAAAAVRLDKEIPPWRSRPHLPRVSMGVVLIPKAMTGLSTVTPRSNSAIC